MVSGACFTGLVLYILFALSYYALIKATLSLSLIKRAGRRTESLAKARSKRRDKFMAGGWKARWNSAG